MGSIKKLINSMIKEELEKISLKEDVDTFVSNNFTQNNGFKISNTSQRKPASEYYYKAIFDEDTFLTLLYTSKNKSLNVTYNRIVYIVSYELKNGKTIKIRITKKEMDEALKDIKDMEYIESNIEGNNTRYTFTDKGLQYCKELSIKHELPKIFKNIKNMNENRKQLKEFTDTMIKRNKKSADYYFNYKFDTNTLLTFIYADYTDNVCIQYDKNTYILSLILQENKNNPIYIRVSSNDMRNTLNDVLRDKVKYFTENGANFYYLTDQGKKYCEENKLDKNLINVLKHVTRMNKNV